MASVTVLHHSLTNPTQMGSDLRQYMMEKTECHASRPDIGRLYAVTRPSDATSKPVDISSGQ